MHLDSDMCSGMVHQDSDLCTGGVICAPRKSPVRWDSAPGQPWVHQDSDLCTGRVSLCTGTMTCAPGL